MPQSTPSLTLALLQARESAMGFFRPLLNRYGVTEQQWRVIRILRQTPDSTLESREVADLACILRPSLTGVLGRLERDGLVKRWKPETDQRRLCVTLTERGEALFDEMSKEMVRQYELIQEQLGPENFRTLMQLLRKVQGLHPGDPGPHT